ncbi:MAG: hypothetical protein WB493_11935 [Anaeromyxobacteraceae bacterium]
MSPESVGQGGGGSGGGTAQAAGALYGDLYVIERDGNGEPVTRAKTILGVTYVCQQPLAADCSMLPLNYDKGDFNAELEDACAVQSVQSMPEPVDYTLLLQEVKFGRESVSRAPATVIDKSYGEALKSINLALPAASRNPAAGNVDRCTNASGSDGRAIKLDPAGRVTLCLATEKVPATNPPTYTYAWKTIDAPLENLGLYRAVMTNGCFGPVTEEKVGEEGVRITVTIELSESAKANLRAAKANPSDPNDPGLGHLVCAGTLPNPIGKADMLSAAVFLAGGADKSSPVTLDEVINLNNYVGVNKWTYTTSKKVKTLLIDYFDFKVPGGDWFKYTKGVDAGNPNHADNTVSLLTKSVFTTSTGGVLFEPQSVSVFGTSPPGVALRPGAAVTVCRGGSPLPFACDDATNNPVYQSNFANGCGGANWFTQAAEDARKTIWYVHNWRLPEIAY